MTAILEAYASDDRYHLDYASISVSEEFRRYEIPLNLNQNHSCKIILLMKLAFTNFLGCIGFIFTQLVLCYHANRYVNMVQDLQRVDVFKLSGNEKLTFFMNLHNAMIIHAIVRVNRQGIIDRRSAFFSDFHYMIGGNPYSLSSIKDGILRSNRRQPYSISKPFSTGDRRMEVLAFACFLSFHQRSEENESFSS